VPHLLQAPNVGDQLSARSHSCSHQAQGRLQLDLRGRGYFARLGQEGFPLAVQLYIESRARAKERKATEQRHSDDEEEEEEHAEAPRARCGDRLPS
jgi:hypothetical protein